MRSRFTNTSLAFVFVGLLVGAANAEPVLSPRYTSWAKFKTGTSITRTIENRVGVQSATADIKHTLVEVTPDKAVLKLETVTKTNGQTIASPPMTVDIPAKTEKYADLLGANVKATFTENRTETVEIAGRSLTCRVIDFVGEQASRQGGQPIKVKGSIWVSDDIPGAIVQIIQESQVAAADGTIAEGTTNTAVASISIKE